MKKIRRSIKPEHAKLLGLDLKPNQKGRNYAQYQITDKQNKKLEKIKSKDNKVKVSSNSDTKPNDYKEEVFFLSAYCKETNSILNIEDYCNKYNLDYSNVSSFKFLPYHYKEPSYNIVFKENIISNSLDYDFIINKLKKETKKTYEYKETKYSFNKENVLKWSDLHFGSYIRNLMHVNDFDTNILLDGLVESINVINKFKFKKTHIHINGDLIESFSGLNHINSWQSMDNEMIGANVIKMCSKMLDTAFKKVNNLGKIKIVAGNHDRLSKANDEDVKGGGAELIAFCLELMGYDVEFHPYVITHYVDGINHINLHGDKGISKKTTETIILDYGIQGEYNLINEGHLHSVIEKLSIKQRESFDVVKDDSINHRRFYLPSFFTGNYYSATLGYTTNSGYFSIWNNGKNKPQFFNGSI